MICLCDHPFYLHQFLNSIPMLNGFSHLISNRKYIFFINNDSQELKLIRIVYSYNIMTCILLHIDIISILLHIDNFHLLL